MTLPNLKGFEMKRKNLVMIVIVFALVGLSARGQQIKFQKMYKDSLFPSQGDGIIQTSDGDYVILKNRMSINCVNQEVCLMKSDINGNVLWSKYYTFNWGGILGLW
jgi:hypothetical protein